MPIDTTNVTDCRVLRFESMADVLADAERIAASDRAGTLRRTGNWTAAQAMNHVSAFMEYPYDGYPKELSTPPWFVRVILKLMKNKYMKGPLPKGVKIPKIPGGTVGATDGPIDAAMVRFKKAAARLKASAPTVANPIFGPMSHEEWVQLHCRHAELHFGYLHP
ncbi:MAG TPA: DUF1569 domain-containing protein [Phycisphaerales bacterium]|nr:DUF1569 domain-containing protein [Phycisphaerales bacterium]